MQSVCHQKGLVCVFFFGGGEQFQCFFSHSFAYEFSGSREVGFESPRDLVTCLWRQSASKPRNTRGETRGCFLVENCPKPGTGSSGWCLKPENVNKNSKSEFSLSSLRTSCSTTTILKTLTVHTLPPIIMVQWPIGVSPIVVSFSFGVVFHFHDYWRKGNDSFGRCWWEMLWIRKYGHGLHAHFMHDIDMGKLHVR